MLAHRLAAARGFPHANYLLAELTSTEFAELVALETFDPTGSLRDDWRFAQLAAILYNAHRAKSAPPLGVADFMWEQPEPIVQTAAEQRRIMREVLTIASGSHVVK